MGHHCIEEMRIKQNLLGTSQGYSKSCMMFICDEVQCQMFFCSVFLARFIVLETSNFNKIFETEVNIKFADSEYYRLLFIEV